MNAKMTAFALVCTALLLTLFACRGSEDPGRAGAPDTTPAPADTARLGVIYTRLNEAYDSLMARYEATASETPAEEQQLYRSMAEMHAQADGMHRAMMGGGTGRGTMGRGMMGRSMGRGGMMGSGMHGGISTVREWDEQMLGMHRAMAAMHRQGGSHDMAAMHERMAQLYGEALRETPSGEVVAPEPEGETPSGADVFGRNCAACHGAEGRGMASVFPPLAGSAWVTGQGQTPIRIVLYGLQGSIQVGENTFNGMMPAFGARLSDREIASVLSYIRSSWGNSAPGISPADVSAVREAEAGRTGPFTPEALR